MNQVDESIERRRKQTDGHRTLEGSASCWTQCFRGRELHVCPAFVWQEQSDKFMDTIGDSFNLLHRLAFSLVCSKAFGRNTVKLLQLKSFS